MYLNEMNDFEQQEVNGGYTFSDLLTAFVLTAVGEKLGKAIYDSFDDERERAMKDAVDDARKDYANGFRY